WASGYNETINKYFYSDNLSTSCNDYGISITPTTRYPTLSITYEGVAVDGSANHGAIVELVLGEPIDSRNHYNHASCGVLFLQTYTPEADNTFAVVEAGESVCLYSGAVAYEGEVNPGEPALPEDLIRFDWVSLSYLESTPTITQEYCLYGGIQIKYDNYFYFYMPASDVVLKIKTS
ncbi:MAG: hypothetical protein IKT27_02615, partial [Clostridia bacterium]|nr:hypothetical protein [Clostridia bacterium]